MIRCVAFDFDGTLVDSNRIKQELFFEVAAAFSGSVSAMGDVLRETRGDRFEIFRRFIERSPELLIPNAADPAAALAAEYTRRCECAIAVCATIPGAERLLDGLRSQRVMAAVVSATPTVPLESVIARRGWQPRFAYVLGDAADKAVSLRQLAAKAGLGPHEIVMVGDRQVDKAGAASFGCAFVGVTRPDSDFTEPPTWSVTDLGGVMRLIGLEDR
ncbi:MAG: HAD family hydrolase [Vicinamibacterales bacterium]|jgi:phosphoglycolate phosphatase-like HAD superfamily hydrolase